MVRRRTQNLPGLAVGYVRASVETDQSLGPEAQGKALARWCQANGVELVSVFEDLGISGGAPLERRPGLLAALEALQRHRAGVLLVAKRDRLARDVVVSAMVEQLVERAGGRVLTADGTGNGEGPEAQLMRTMVDAFAAYERELIKARTRAALATKKSRGERTGGIPFGFRLCPDGRSLEPDPAEQAVVERVRTLRADRMSIRAIAAKLDEEGVPARGRRWHPTTVERLLRRLVAC